MSFRFTNDTSQKNDVRIVEVHAVAISATAEAETLCWKLTRLVEIQKVAAEILADGVKNQRRGLEFNY